MSETRFHDRVRVTREGGVATVCLDRADKLNALDAPAPRAAAPRSRPAPAARAVPPGKPQS